MKQALYPDLAMFELTLIIHYGVHFQNWFGIQTGLVRARLIDYRLHYNWKIRNRIVCY